jgi:hypothetical protein
VIYNQLKVDIREILRDLCKYKGVETGRAFNAGSHPYAGNNSPKILGIKFYGIFEREIRLNDI